MYAYGNWNTAGREVIDAVSLLSSFRRSQRARAREAPAPTVQPRGWGHGGGGTGPVSRGCSPTRARSSISPSPGRHALGRTSPTGPDAKLVWASTDAARRITNSFCSSRSSRRRSGADGSGSAGYFHRWLCRGHKVDVCFDGGGVAHCFLTVIDEQK